MKIGAVSLGCDKNRVDTEKMLARLVEAGHGVVGTEDEADVLIVNTCAFTEDAKNESIDEILALISAGRRGGQKVIVTGCLAQRYPEALQEEFPEIAAILGVRDYDRVAAVVERLSDGGRACYREGGDAFYAGRVLTTPYHYAYLKIADGCDNRCTYCAIPGIRGRYRSENADNLLAEASRLSLDGVRELILVAQDVTRYGVDFDGKPHLTELIDRLSELDFDWIRLLYLEPEMVDARLIEYISSNPKVCKYMDIPLQHVDDGVLKRMGRRTSEAYTRRLVADVKAAGITLRTSFISGFPGESAEAHDKLKEFITEAEIDYAGIFAYSREEGTPADRLKGHLPEAVKRARAEELRAAEAEVIARLNLKKAGQRVRVIYEGIDFDRQIFRGRSASQAPDIDGVTYFTSDSEVLIGNFYEIEITGADGVDLIGRRV